MSIKSFGDVYKEIKSSIVPNNFSFFREEDAIDINVDLDDNYQIASTYLFEVIMKVHKNLTCARPTHLNKIKQRVLIVNIIQIVHMVHIVHILHIVHIVHIFLTFRSFNL